MRYLLLAVLVLLSGCDHQRLHESSFLTFGTIVELSLYAGSPEQARQAFSLTEAELASMHRNWHAWHPGPLTQVNQLLQTGRPFKADHNLLPIIEQARELSIQSSGLFNPAIGKLIAAWGFHQDSPEKAAPPTTATIAALLDAKPLMQDIHIHQGKIVSNNPAVQLDFGAYAKGYGLGMIAEKLKVIGVHDFILNAGGDLVAHGRHLNRPWRIAIRDPDGHSALAVLQARSGEAIFTSGDYERFYVTEGKRRHHIIDPRSGYPAEATRAVTVIHSDPARADAAATALFIAGPEDWPKIATDMEITYVLLLDSNQIIHMTAEMADRIQLSNTSSYEIKVISASPSQK